jgi:hypothetical protein
MRVSATDTDKDSAAEILLKILEQLQPTGTEQDKRIRLEIERKAKQLQARN